MTDSTTGPLSYQVIRETWLSRKPGPDAGMVAAGSVLALAVGSLVYWLNFLGLGDLMGATGTAVYERHEVWRLWTTLFAHGDVFHLLANSLLFLVLGYFLRGYFGAYAFPYVAFFYGGVTNAVSLLTYPPRLTLIGASGLVSWMGGAWLTLYVLIYRQRTPGARALRAAGVALAIFAPAEAFDPQISYRTHVIGFALGVGWAAAYFYRRRDTFRAAERIETVVEEDDLIDAENDPTEGGFDADDFGPDGEGDGQRTH